MNSIFGDWVLLCETGLKAKILGEVVGRSSGLPLLAIVKLEDGES